VLAWPLRQKGSPLRRPTTEAGRLACRLGIAVLTALPACGESSPTSPSSGPALTQVTASTHYTIHTAPGDTVDAVWQDAYHEWLLAALQLPATERLDYHKYRDRAHMQALTGRNTNGFAEPGTTRFHTIWPTDNHEVVHTIVILHFGFPPALFTEGVAVAHSTDPLRAVLKPRWNSTDVDVLARTYDASGRLPPVGSLLGSTDFFRFDINITYPCAGSFVRYLIDRYGLSPLKTYFASATFEDVAAVTETRFQAAYGHTVPSLWDEWRAQIR
jgi:hypothetical protein